MIYLDNAATTFLKPECVKKSVLYALNNLGSPGRGGYLPALRAAETVYSAREALARLFNIQTPESIVFTDNATTAINTALKGILSPGDSFAISGMEHNAVARPSESLKQKGCHLYIADGNSDGYITKEAVKKVIFPGMRLFCLIHSSNVCGSLNNLCDIGNEVKKLGLIFMVDASQSAGCTDIDVEKAGIDILAFPGHKALFGPQGIGGLYIREGINISPLTEGGTGSMSESLLQPTVLPDRFESGTLNVPAIAGLLSGVKFILRHGAENIGKAENELTKILAEDLSEIKGITLIGKPFSDEKTAVLSVSSDKDCIELSTLLFKNYGICTRAGLHCAPMAHRTLGTIEDGTIRFSPGIFTRKEDIKRTAYAVSRCLKEM